MNTPDISIIVYAYNCQELISGCLDSILEQQDSYKCEIIVVNDGSTDETAKRIDDMYHGHQNVKIITHKEHQGPSSAYNTGLEKATSEYIMFIGYNSMVGINPEPVSFYMMPHSPYFQSAFDNAHVIDKKGNTRLFPKNDEDFKTTYFPNIFNAIQKCGTQPDIILGGNIAAELLGPEFKEDASQRFNFLTPATYNLFYNSPQQKLEILRCVRNHEIASFAVYRREMLNKHNLRFLTNMNIYEQRLFCMQAVLFADTVITVPDTISFSYCKYDLPEEKAHATVQQYGNFLIELQKFPQYKIVIQDCMKKFASYNDDYMYTFSIKPENLPPTQCAQCRKTTCSECPIYDQFIEKLPGIIKQINQER